MTRLIIFIGEYYLQIWGIFAILNWFMWSGVRRSYIDGTRIEKKTFDSSLNSIGYGWFFLLGPVILLLWMVNCIDNAMTPKKWLFPLALRPYTKAEEAQILMLRKLEQP